MTFDDIKNNEEVKGLIETADRNLCALGYTEHAFAHCTKVSHEAFRILDELGYPEHEKELAGIAGYLHDIGNAINRSRHAEYGAILAKSILDGTDMALADKLTVMSAIANHDESTGGANDVISAALIIADKTDVRRNRVRNKAKAQFDIHDRVNYAVCESSLSVDSIKKEISLNLTVDEEICTMYDYFDIFLGRMMMCRKASEILGCIFRLYVNGRKVL